ncbi:P-loop containing nucleoside triphosphate hydrolase protein [Zopfochytrium polystomum]|nr:P-loop containing nucleoside triphosphate hydrolase protein [Zopfochytrium polystomum]
MAKQQDLLPGEFRPPTAFIKASQARLEHIKRVHESRLVTTGPNAAQNEVLKPARRCVVPRAAPEHLPSATDPGRLSSVTAPSKTVLSVTRLKEAREERRALAAAARRADEYLDAADRDYLMYQEWIQQFSVPDEGMPEECASQCDQRISVCVRKRPLNAKEIQSKEFNVVSMKTTVNAPAAVYVHEPKITLDQSRRLETHKFIMDSAFDEAASNWDIYRAVVASLVQKLFQNGACTLFAYGQTGSGKTHTLFGSEKEVGIYEFACRDIFTILQTLESNKSTANRCILAVSFYEVYGSKVFDLLSGEGRSMQLLEDKNGVVRILGLREVAVKDLDHMLELVRIGKAHRKTGLTRANSSSSRSHAVFQIKLHESSESERKSSTPAPAIPSGTLSLVDLAGSERAADAGSVGQKTRNEGANINRSLLALKECIRALQKLEWSSGRPADHVPFRGSKLTQILRDSFIGKNSQTAMIATISPGCGSAEHTLNTLRYASRVKDFQCGKEKVLQRRTTGGGKHLHDHVPHSQTSSNSSASSRTQPEDHILDAGGAEVASSGNTGHGQQLRQLLSLHRESILARRELLAGEEEILKEYEDSGDAQCLKRRLKESLRRNMSVAVTLWDRLEELREDDDQKNPFLSEEWDCTASV